MGLFSRKKSKKDDWIDLRELMPETVAAQETWGQPGKCPKCKVGRGFLDQIDVRARVMHQHCRDCGHEWQVCEVDLNQN